MTEEEAQKIIDALNTLVEATANGVPTATIALAELTLCYARFSDSRIYLHQDAFEGGVLALIDKDTDNE